MKLPWLLALGLLSTLNPQLSTAFAQGTAFTYQGRFNDSGGPFMGSAEFQFSLWDAASGGNPVAGTNTVIAAVTNGLFAVPLDFGSEVFTGADRWLQIEVRTSIGPFTGLSPRQRLTAAPYAIYAGRAMMLDGTLLAGQLAGTYSNALIFDNPLNQFTGDGTGLTNVNAARLAGSIATPSNTPSTIVSRDASGNINANYVLAAYFNSSDNSVSSGITGVMVKRGDNYHRTATASALAVFAANACGTVNAGPTCGSAENIGQIGWGGSTSRSGALPSGGSAEHWYRVSWTSSGANYHPHVYLTSGVAYYTFDVFYTCSSPLAIGRSNWETTSQVTLPPGTTVYVRVRPYTANPTCQSFTIILQNG